MDSDYYDKFYNAIDVMIRSENLDRDIERQLDKVIALYKFGNPLQNWAKHPANTYELALNIIDKFGLRGTLLIYIDKIIPVISEGSMSEGQYADNVMGKFPQTWQETLKGR